MFSTLSQKLSDIFNKLKGHGILTPEIIEKSMREIRIALLESDVALPVVKELIGKLKEKLTGQEVIVGTSPWQTINKHLNDELLELFGNVQPKLRRGAILLCGLQGTGKTTTAAKLAKILQSKVLLVSLDTYRPAAIDQLQKLAKSNNLQFFDDFDLKSDTAISIAKRVQNVANDFDYIIYDSAGRLDIDVDLMKELKEISDIVRPSNTILVIDSMMGQIALKTANAFNEQIKLNGLIMTKADGDSRGGAIISANYVTNCPVLYVCTGEKIDDIEVFNPKRVVSRILDNEDILSAVADLSANVDPIDFSGEFTIGMMEKYFTQLDKMRNFNWIFGIIPGLKKFREQINQAISDKKTVKHQIAIIRSMTKKERANYKILNASRRRRIAYGAGCQVSEVNELVKHYEQISNIMNKINKYKRKYKA